MAGQRAGRSGDRGMVLVVALLLLVVLALLGGALLGLSLNEHELARLQEEGAQALYLADAGIERARAELNRRLDAAPSKTDFDAELGAADGYLFGSNSGAVALTVGGHAVGTYRVHLTDNEDGGGPTDDRDKIVWATAEGTVTRRGHPVRRRVQALLGPSPPGAFLMGCAGGPGSLALGGGALVDGSRGSIHSNCNIAVSGTPSVGRNLTATGTITGSPTVGGTIAGGAPAIPVPSINPATYRPLADYAFKEFPAGSATCPAGCAKIYAGDGVTEVFDATAGGIWPAAAAGWRYSGTPGVSGTWWYEGGGVPPEVQGKTFYFAQAGGAGPGETGNAKVSGSPGSAADNWRTTLVAEGHIDVSGNPTMRAHSQNLLFVAGTDVAIAGTTAATWSLGGIVAAHEQVALSGNPKIVGFVVAENAASGDPFVGATAIGGNARITYNGLPSAPWPAPIVVLVWRELTP